MINITEFANGRRVFDVDVGDMSAEDAKNYINKVMERLKKTKNSITESSIRRKISEF